MLRRLIGMIALAAALTVVVAVARAGGPAPMSWSPDGDWIAYVVAAPAVSGPLPTDWAFRTGQPRTEARSRPPRTTPLDRRRSRLWATRVGSGSSILLEDCVGPITPVGWSPDGKSLAFGRVVDEGRGLRYEVVCLEGTRRRVLLTQSVVGWGDDASRLERSAIAWSGDGRYLAVPHLRPSGLAIVRAENGRTIRVIEGAEYPAWSPDGGRLFFISTGDQDRLECLDGHFGAGRHLADVGQSDGPPVVARNGQTVTVLSRGRGDGTSPPMIDSVAVQRIRLEDGWRDRLTTLPTPGGRDKVVLGSSLTQDRDGENIFASVNIAGQSRQVTWFRPRERAVYKMFPVLDASIGAGDLSLCPAGGVLAIRMGGPGPSGVPLLCDLESLQLTPLAPDEATRSAWAALLLETASAIVEEGCTAPVLDGRGIVRPVSLPLPGEVDPSSEVTIRLRRLGRLGRSVAGPRRSEAGQGWDEARLLFDYFQEDYGAALIDLEGLDARPGDPRRSRQLLAIRAGVYAGLHDFDRARATLDYLRAYEARRSRRLVEETSLGPIVSDLPAADFGWADYATRKVAAIEAEAKKEDADDPTRPERTVNPDAPAPGLGMDAPLPDAPFAPDRPRRRSNRPD